MSIPYRAGLLVVALCCGLPAQEQVPHPQSALWAGIKRQLTGPDGEQYFESNMKGTALPSLRGTVVGVSAPNLVQLNLSGGSAPEVLLLLSAGQELPRKGSDIVFGQAEPIAFTREPFLLTMEVSKGTAEGPITNCPSGPAFPESYGPPLGVVINGRYYHELTRIEFDVPPGWCVRNTSPSADNGEIATLFHANPPEAYAGVWMLPDRITLTKIPTRLQAAIPEKIKQRSAFANYTIRPESIDSTWIGGHQALRAIADYEEDGRQMSETLTWIFTEHTRAFFFARAETREMPALQTHFDQIIYSANIP
jgi:hypothetical protein